MYQVIGEIGKGGSGIIYLGYHLRLQKQIVIKKIKDINVGQINTRIEADILKKLHHRYLPQVYDFLEMQDGIYTIIKRLVNPNVPMGFSALMAAVVFFGGMIMIMLGLIGEYVGRIYISMNNSPQYVIREKIHLGEEDR